MTFRNYNKLDNIITSFDEVINGLFHNPTSSTRAVPGSELAEPTLTDEQRKISAALMRVNHAGEIAAQGLYQGQALTAKLTDIREQMQQAAIEEKDHLFWCSTRLEELGSRPSYLQPLWYLGSVAIGAIAGIAGDKWSLGFVAETEKQVAAHLENHQTTLPKADNKSHAIIQQMHIDETKHAENAIAAGAKTLPSPIQFAMRFVSKIMTSTAYWI